jgi:hypothetical protein
LTKQKPQKHANKEYSYDKGEFQINRKDIICLKAFGQ